MNLGWHKRCERTASKVLEGMPLWRTCNRVSSRETRTSSWLSSSSICLGMFKCSGSWMSVRSMSVWSWWSANLRFRKLFARLDAHVILRTNSLIRTITYILQLCIIYSVSESLSSASPLSVPASRRSTASLAASSLFNSSRMTSTSLSSLPGPTFSITASARDTRALCGARCADFLAGLFSRRRATITGTDDF